MRLGRCTRGMVGDIASGGGARCAGVSLGEVMDIIGEVESRCGKAIGAGWLVGCGEAGAFVSGVEGGSSAEDLAAGD